MQDRLARPGVQASPSSQRVQKRYGMTLDRAVWNQQHGISLDGAVTYFLEDCVAIFLNLVDHTVEV